jgi:hypothetical protein
VFVDGDGMVVSIDDWALFDYVDDFLTEGRSIEYEYMRETPPGFPTRFEMHFPSSVSREQIVSALAELDDEEVERICRLNHPL